MALILAATNPDVFAGVGVHSAPPYRAATGPARAFSPPAPPRPPPPGRGKVTRAVTAYSAATSRRSPP
jgi:poly(3-hydroxybutyrate) depolymerase